MDYPHSTTVRCFVSMPFASEFDEVFSVGIANVNDYVKDFRLDFIHLDRETYARRMIEENVLRYIDSVDMLIADISMQEGSLQPSVNVMHEIGYATGRGIPLLLIGRKDTFSKEPTNLKGSLLLEYDSASDRKLNEFSCKLAQQLRAIIETEVIGRMRGEFQIDCFTDYARTNRGLPELIRRAKKRILILTTNLCYTEEFLLTALVEALQNQQSNPGFKVQILTMDPEAEVTNARAHQLDFDVRHYRDKLRQSLDNIRKVFEQFPRVEIGTYSSLPTQTTFIVDDVVVTTVMSMARQSREGLHFAIHHVPEVTEIFVSHFRTVNALR